MMMKRKNTMRGTERARVTQPIKRNKIIMRENENKPKRNMLLSWLFNLFTTIHDGNFRRHLSMNVTIK